jgi:hypothetical protein
MGGETIWKKTKSETKINLGRGYSELSKKEEDQDSTRTKSKPKIRKSRAPILKLLHHYHKRIT